MEKEFHKSLVEILRIRRVELGLTQTFLSKKLGISPQAYSHIETGRLNINVYETYMLMKELGLPFKETLDKATESSVKVAPREENIKKIFITNIKGGTGASTLAILLSNKISMTKKVILVDADIQRSCISKRNKDKITYPEVPLPYQITCTEIAQFKKFTYFDNDHVLVDCPFKHLMNRQLEINYLVVPFDLNPFFDEKELKFIDYPLGMFTTLLEFKSQKPDIKFILVPIFTPKDTSVHNKFVEWALLNGINVTKSFNLKSEIHSGSLRVNTLLLSDLPEFANNVLNDLASELFE